MSTVPYDEKISVQASTVPIPADGVSRVRESSLLLHPLTAALLECVTPGEVVAAVVERGIAVLGAHAGLVALITRDGQELEVVRTSGYAPQASNKWGRFRVDGPFPLSDVVRDGTTLFLRDRADWEARYPILVGDIEDAFQASVSLSLAARQRVFGAMHFSFTEPRGFTESDQEFLQELAYQCALALERALLLEELEQARRNAEAMQTRQEYLSRASVLLSQSLDYQPTLDAVTRLAVPDLSDWATVDTIDPSDADGMIRNIAVAHVSPTEVEWVRAARQRYPIDMSQKGQPMVRAIETGATVFLPDIPEEVLVAAAQDAEHLRMIRKLDLRSYLCVPLIARGKTLGAITFASTRSSGRVFTSDTVCVVEELARRAAIALDNARLYEEAQREAHNHAEAEARFRVMADNAPVLIWTSGTDTKCDWFNEPWLRFTGRTIEQEIGDGWSENVHPDDFVLCMKTYRGSFQARQPFTMEYRLRRGDGMYRWLLDTGVPVFDRSKTFKGYIGSCLDITEMKQNQIERERLVVELREASLRQRQFLKEMLAGFTEGRLRVCFTASELPKPLAPQSEIIDLTPASLRLLRKQIEGVAEELKLPQERLVDFETAVHEAGMNAIKYGGGGTARVHGDIPTGGIQVWVEDHGPGIAEDLIHRAVERGYTTAGFGHGMFFMQSCADRLFLLTGANGTTVVLEQDPVSPTPGWLDSAKTS